MRKKPNRTRLKMLMAQHDIDCSRVAEITGVNVETVWSWRTKSSGRDITKEKLQQLRNGLRGEHG